MDQDVQMGGTVDDMVVSTDSGVPVTSAPDALIPTESNDAPVTSASVGMDMDPPTIAETFQTGNHLVTTTPSKTLAIRQRPAAWCQSTQ